VCNTLTLVPRMRSWSVTPRPKELRRLSLVKWAGTADAMGAGHWNAACRNSGAGRNLGRGPTAGAAEDQRGKARNLAYGTPGDGAGSGTCNLRWRNAEFAFQLAQVDRRLRWFLTGQPLLS